MINNIIKDITNILENDEKQKKIVFKETDGVLPFPEMTMNALKKEIKKMSSDLSKEWPSTIAVVNAAFDELEVPKPLAFNKDRWEQYCQMIKVATKELVASRGFSGWTKLI